MLLVMLVSPTQFMLLPSPPPVTLTPPMLVSAPTTLELLFLARQWTESDVPTSQSSLGTSELLVNIHQCQLSHLVI